MVDYWSRVGYKQRKAKSIAMMVFIVLIAVCALALTPWAFVTVANWFLPVAHQLHFKFWQYVVMGIALNALGGFLKKVGRYD